MNAPAAQSERSHSVHLDLGRVVATPAALDLVRAHGLDVLALVHRHAGGDWGDVSEHDARANDSSVEGGTRVLSAYDTRGGPLRHDGPPALRLLIPCLPSIPALLFRTSNRT